MLISSDKAHEEAQLLSAKRGAWHGSILGSPDAFL